MSYLYHIKLNRAVIPSENTLSGNSVERPGSGGTFMS